MKNVNYILALFLTILVVSCGGTGSTISPDSFNDGTSSGGEIAATDNGEDEGSIELNNSITIKGTLSASALFSKSIDKSFIYVDTVYAVDEDGNYVLSHITPDGEFNLELSRPGIYAILFYGNGAFRASYRADAFELDSLPIMNFAGGTIDLGWIYFSGQYASSDMDWVEFFDSLLIDEKAARQIGLYDDGLINQSNKIKNTLSGHGSDPRFAVAYLFRGLDGNEAAINDFPDYDAVEYNGYMFYFGVSNYLFSSWPSAYLYAPDDITTAIRDVDGNVVEFEFYKKGEPIESCWNINELESRFFNHLCGGSGYDDQPPEGTYEMKISNVTFTFDNIQTKTIRDTSGLMIPLPKIVVDNDGWARSIEWKWMWQTENGEWIEPTTAQIRNVIQSGQNSSGLEIRLNNGAGYRIPITTEHSGSKDLAVPVKADHIKGVFISYIDISGFSYGIDWF